MASIDFLARRLLCLRNKLNAFDMPCKAVSLQIDWFFLQSIRLIQITARHWPGATPPRYDAIRSKQFDIQSFDPVNFSGMSIAWTFGLSSAVRDKRSKVVSRALLQCLFDSVLVFFGSANRSH